jgi:hypothetical protein
MEEKKDTNPKDSFGVKKVGLHVLPCGVLMELALAMTEGGLKYGAHNYRAMGVRASVYYDAAMRHLMAWWEGQDIDPDSGVSHVIKAMACLLVVRDGQIMGNWEDDRPIQVPGGLDIVGLNKLAAELITKYPAGKAPYTQIGTKTHEEIEKLISLCRDDIPVHDYSELCYCDHCQARRNAG